MGWEVGYWWVGLNSWPLWSRDTWKEAGLFSSLIIFLGTYVELQGGNFVLRNLEKLVNGDDFSQMVFVTLQSQSKSKCVSFRIVEINSWYVEVFMGVGIVMIALQLMPLSSEFSSLKNSIFLLSIYTQQNYSPSSAKNLYQPRCKRLSDLMPSLDPISCRRFRQTESETIDSSGAFPTAGCPWLLAHHWRHDSRGLFEGSRGVQKGCSRKRCGFWGRMWLIPLQFKSLIEVWWFLKCFEGLVLNLFFWYIMVHLWCCLQIVLCSLSSEFLILENRRRHHVNTWGGCHKKNICTFKSMCNPLACLCCRPLLGLAASRSWSCWRIYPPENQHDSGNSRCSIGNTSSNGGFSIVMLVFGGVKVYTHE